MGFASVQVLLFDLDGCLLGLDIGEFAPVYRKAVARRFSPYIEPERMLEAILYAESMMMAPPATREYQTIEAVYFSALRAFTGLAEDVLRETVRVFYEVDMPALGGMAEALPEAQRLLTSAVDRGYRIALATNPIFPRPGIRERMRWAGIESFPFELITTWEFMHASKPYPEYYQEVARILGVDPGECLMVGNDAQHDMAASVVGMQTYLVTGPYLDDRGFPRYEPSYSGSLAELAALL